MNSITSLFDLFNKAKADDRYRRLAVMVCEDHYGGRCNFDKAKEWLDRWVDRHHQLPTTKGFFSCQRMVDHVNSFIYKIEDGEKLISEIMDDDED